MVGDACAERFPRICPGAGAEGNLPQGLEGCASAEAAPREGAADSQTTTEGAFRAIKHTLGAGHVHQCLERDVILPGEFDDGARVLVAARQLADNARVKYGKAWGAERARKDVGTSAPCAVHVCGLDADGDARAPEGNRSGDYAWARAGHA